MSNPFLADLEESYTPFSGSGTTTPYSTGGATPKRRMSTNPFEILSPEGEGPGFLDPESLDAAASKLNNNVANTIADMTADFYETITKSYDYDKHNDGDDVFQDNENTEETPATKTVNTVFDEAGVQVFDPFETIHDDDGAVSSKRSSLEQNTMDVGATFRASKAKDLFHSSMAEMEMLAATQDPSDPDHLQAPNTTDLCTSDVSDLSDISPIVSNEDAFQSKHIYADKDEEENIKADGFDPFTRVSDSPTIDEPQVEAASPSIGVEEYVPRYSIDIEDVGQPNESAQGIENDGFEENTTVEPYRKSSIDIVPVETRNVQPNDLRKLIENNDGDNVDDEGKEGEETKFDAEAFDAFESQFEAKESTTELIPAAVVDPFASPFKSIVSSEDKQTENAFDSSFEPVMPKQPENTPYKVRKPIKKKKDSFEDSFDDDDDDDDDDEPEENLRIVIRERQKPSENESNSLAPVPLLPPPPKSPKHLPLMKDEEEEEEEEEENEEDKILTGYKSKSKTKSSAKSFLDEEFDRFFLNSENRTTGETEGEENRAEETEWPTAFGEAGSKRVKHTSGDSPASPQTPLYDEDTTQPLEEFPLPYLGDGWEMMLRHPAKKKITANRYWKKIYVRFISDTCVLQLYNKKEDTQPFQELPLQASYSLSDISAQYYDQYGKIFTIKVQYIFYREKVGVRPGQIAKVMQGQIQSIGDIARLGMPVEHAPQVSELLKIGSLEYSDCKELLQVVSEAMFRMVVHRDRALTYKTEEIQCVVQDEIYIEQSRLGLVERQLARVRVFFLAFLNGMPTIEVGINDLRRQGKEVVGRYDILPIVTEEWIRVEAPEFHSCVQSDCFDTDQVVKLIPPDACHFELMRFRVRPPRNRELPLQVTANMNITATKMELKCDVLVPGCISRKQGQIPCEDIQIRFHIPECWIYFFRVEKHFRYGAVHSTNRRSGKLKGLDRLLGTAANPEPQLIEVTAGLAKYEHVYHSIVWRIPKLPKEGQGAYTQQFMVVRLPLSSFDRIPETFYDYVHIEYTMPSTTVSHTTIRSISVGNSTSEMPPEKFVRHMAKYEYRIGLSITYDDTKPEPEYMAVVSSSSNNGTAKACVDATPAGAASSGEEEDMSVR